MNIQRLLILIAFVLCAFWQLALAQETWVQGENVSIEAKTCRGEEFVLLESHAGYLDLPEEAVFPIVGGTSTLGIVVTLGHPCVQDGRKDVVSLSLELSLPAGIVPSDLTPTCYVAATTTEDYKDISAEADFDCTATLTPTNKINLGSRDLPGGTTFLVHLPVTFSKEISESASYKEGTARFALETPTRNANVIVRIPVGYAPLIRYLEPSARFLEDMMVIDALIDTNGKAGQVFLDYVKSDSSTAFESLAPLTLADTQGYFQVHALFGHLEPGSYRWRVRFVSESGESYVGAEQTFSTPSANPSAVKP